MEATARSRSVTAVLGPTNTGKTHLAIERMLSHDTGMIGLPLRLLAREVYDKIANRVGPDKVALITGEEKIKPEEARYWVSTVEAMPREVSVDFLAIDEIQLAADPERGHTFTDRLLHARGQLETLMLGAGTMREAIADLIPGANFISRPRLSKLTYSGQKKITRLPERSAIVAFSSNDVYAIAELIRRQRGGAAVVLGALSPRTRNAQVALYQSGDVDYLVATDAIGMGLNLDVDHVAFSAVRKFDGQNHRNLTPAELGQIGGRAGRHMNDGTFGVTGDVEPFDNELVERLECHNFEPVKTLQWRARNLDFATLDNLRESLRQGSDTPRLIRARMADDVIALETLSADAEVRDAANSRPRVELLWDACQIPDYRKISSQNHAELVGRIYKDIVADGTIDEDWFAKQVAFSDRTDGDIDTLANRIAHIRTWTFISNRSDWLKDPAHWQGRTREIEDALSDALHECLTQRFVDKRTSALMKGMRAKDELTAEIGEDGNIQVENHFVGHLTGFRFVPDSRAEDLHGKAARSAAAQVLSKELSMRVRRVAAAKNDAFKITSNAHIVWRDEEIARLRAGEDPLKPRAEIICDEHLQANDRDKVQARLDTYVSDIIAERLKPLVDLGADDEISGLAKGIGFQLIENFGMLRREKVADDIKALDQTARAQLRRHGVRFGAFNIFFPVLLKPAPADLLRSLWFLKNGETAGLDLANPPEAPRPGLTSLRADPALPDAFYAVSGFHVCGPRAVRADMLERLADQIRVLVGWRPNADQPSATPPRGSTGDGGFIVTPEMMSILGCSTDELGEVLRALGFRSEKRPRPAPAAPSTQPAKPAADETASASQPSAADQDATAPGPDAAVAEQSPQTASTAQQAGSAEAASDRAAEVVTPDAEAAAQNAVRADSDGDAAGTPAASEPAPTQDSQADADQTNSAVAKPLGDAEPAADAQPVAAEAPAAAADAKPDASADASIGPAPDASVPPASAQSEADAPAFAGPEPSDQGANAGQNLPSEAADAVAEADSTPSADADASSDEQMIEVWRPRRRSERSGRPDHQRRRGRPAQAGAENAGGERPGGGGRRGQGRRNDNRGGQAPADRPGQAAQQPAASADGKPHQAAQAAGPGQNRSGAAGAHRAGEKNGERGDRRGGGKHEGGRNGRDRGRKQQRGNDRGGPRVTSAGPKNKGVDADSPFAALGALKQALEKQMTDDKT